MPSCSAAAQTQPIPFDSAPLCASVWNPAAPPAAAVPTVLQTVGYLDSVGHFSGSPGQAVLGGTVPWSAYIQVAMAVSFGALDPDTQTPAQEQCLAIFDHALGNTNDFTPVLVSDSKGNTNNLQRLPPHPPPRPAFAFARATASRHGAKREGLPVSQDCLR